MEKKVFRVILVLVVVLLCGYFLFGVVPSALFDTDYTVEAVEDCVYNDTVSVEGVALRTETVLVAGSDCATMFRTAKELPWVLPLQPSATRPFPMKTNSDCCF